MGALVAACGLDCRECDIYRATTDPQLAEKIASWLVQWINEGCDLALSGLSFPVIC